MVTEQRGCLAHLLHSLSIQQAACTRGAPLQGCLTRNDMWCGDFGCNASTHVEVSLIWEMLAMCQLNEACLGQGQAWPPPLQGVAPRPQRRHEALVVKYAKQGQASGGPLLHAQLLTMPGMQVNSEVEATERNQDFCMVCKDGGTLVCCDGCEKAVHAACMGCDNTPEVLPSGCCQVPDV